EGMGVGRGGGEELGEWDAGGSVLRTAGDATGNRQAGRRVAATRAADSHARRAVERQGETAAQPLECRCGQNSLGWLRRSSLVGVPCAVLSRALLSDSPRSATQAPKRDGGVCFQ